MRALRYHTLGRPPEVLEVPRPTPTGRQVLLRVLAAGMCHTDLYFMSLPPERVPFAVPLTLGHEAMGLVESVGPEVRSRDLDADLTYAVYGPWGCGTCPVCLLGQENYCPRAAELKIRPPGLGAQGAMAEYLLVDDPRHLVATGTLDPRQAVALTDAGLTPYHAIRGELDRLAPGATAVVIGVGGLGHMAVQLLRVLTSVDVIAVDRLADKRALATDAGAHHVLDSDEHTAAAIRELTGGSGADVIFDVTGSQQTTALALASCKVNGSIVVIGAGGGTVGIGMGATAYGIRARSVYWGSLPELGQVIALAERELIRVETEHFPLDDGPSAYERLARHEVRGRGVLLP